MNKKGLYIHIPFCHKICPYCDFHKMVGSLFLQNEYIHALIKETKLKEKSISNINTLYIGGGTPSILSVSLLEELLSNLSNYINFKSLDEFTFEVNPEDINDELISLLKKYHVSRVSIGLQTTRPNLQKIINREIDFEIFKKKINIIKKYIDNISIDLMYALPTETLKDVEEDLNLITSLDINHISTYCLILEDKTIFKYNSIQEESDELQSDMYFFINDYLKNKGFYKYETSNFSKKGFESKHNNIYWNLDEYECLGSGASSFVNNIHYKTTTKIKEYISSLNNGTMPDVSKEELSFDELIDEYVSMSLRKVKGINTKRFIELFRKSIDYYFDLSSLVEQNLLIREEDNIFLNDEYSFVSDFVTVKLLNLRKDNA